MVTKDMLYFSHKNPTKGRISKTSIFYPLETNTDKKKKERHYSCQDHEIYVEDNEKLGLLSLISRLLQWDVSDKGNRICRGLVVSSSIL